jgi:hypothetical protein
LRRLRSDPRGHLLRRRRLSLRPRTSMRRRSDLQPGCLRRCHL